MEVEEAQEGGSFPLALQETELVIIGVPALLVRACWRAAGDPINVASHHVSCSTLQAFSRCWPLIVHICAKRWR